MLLHQTKDPLPRTRGAREVLVEALPHRMRMDDLFLEHERYPPLEIFQRRMTDLFLEHERYCNRRLPGIT